MATILGKSDTEYLALLDDVCNGLDTSMGYNFDRKFWNVFSKKLTNQQGVSCDTQSCINWGMHHQMIYNCYKDMPNVPLKHPRLEPTAYRNFLNRIFRDSTICKPKFPEYLTDLEFEQELVDFLDDMHSSGDLTTDEVRRIGAILIQPRKRVVALVILENNLRGEQVAMIHEILNYRD